MQNKLQCPTLGIPTMVNHFLEHPQSIHQNPMPTILSWGFWNELGLWHSNVHSESHNTFPRLASRFISCHFSPFCQRDPISLYTLARIHNKCDSKYTMRSATRMQVLELWSIRYDSFCVRKRKKSTTWL
jgi:hypothetical protein